MKGNKGITLIALVVTIIVLLILAGVAIAMLSGDNGILKRASEAKYENIIGSVDEQVKLAQIALRTDITSKMVNTGTNGYIATTTDNFNLLVNEVKSELGVTATSNPKEGFAVYSYLTQGSTTQEGTGYILITYTDNSLRSSLPASAVADDSFILNGISFDKVVDPASSNAFSVNKATLAYVIKVSNYNCELSKAILTETTTIDNATGIEEKTATNFRDMSGETPSGTYLGKNVSF